MPLCLQALDDAEEIVDLLAGKRGRRLVHDDDAGLDRQGAGNRHQMALRDREVLQPDRRIDIAFERRQQRLRAAVHRLPVDGAEFRARRMAEKDVFGNRQLVEEHGFLMDGGDAGVDRGLGAGEGHRLAVDEDLALVRAGRCRSES